eukprot:11175581-Lingulodinium_polyedra.AAC.1
MRGYDMASVDRVAGQRPFARRKEVLHCARGKKVARQRRQQRATIRHGARHLRVKVAFKAWIN